MLLSLAVLALTAVSATRANEASCKGLVDGVKLEFSEEMEAKVDLEPGQRLHLKCSVMAAPTATVIWFHNGREIDVQDGPKEHIMQRKGKRLGISILESRLVRECTSAEDAGVYTCAALSPCADSVQQSAVVTVTGKGNGCSEESMLAAAAPRISMNTYSRLEIPLTPVQLVCRSVNPLDHVHWERLEEEGEEERSTPLSYRDSGFMQLPSGDLLVSPLALANAEGEAISANFRCVVTDVAGRTAHADTALIYIDEGKK